MEPVDPRMAMRLVKSGMNIYGYVAWRQGDVWPLYCIRPIFARSRGVSPRTQIPCSGKSFLIIDDQAVVTIPQLPSQERLDGEFVTACNRQR